MRILFLLLTLSMLNFSALAVEPDEMLKDTALEARARDLSRNIRCLVCQGEAIDDSGAELAKDLRLLVRERVAAGDTDEAVLQFLRERYGDFILLTPPVEEKTLLLWLTPLLILGAGLSAAAVFIRRHKS